MWASAPTEYCENSRLLIGRTSRPPLRQPRKLYAKQENNGFLTDCASESQARTRPPNAAVPPGTPQTSRAPHFRQNKKAIPFGMTFCSGGDKRDTPQASLAPCRRKAVGSLHAFYPAACVSTHAVVLCDMNGRQMPLSPAPTSSSVPLGLIRRGYVSHRYIGPSVTP